MTTDRAAVARLRQHHGIEHATMTLLGRRAPASHLAARSDLRGFVIYGSVPTEAVREAADGALARLQAGETALAIHPNCGTNLVAAGVMSGLAALGLATGQDRPWYDRAAGAVLGATLALLVAPPAGRWLQKSLTTTPLVPGLRVISVERLPGTALIRHRVTVG